MEKNITPLLEVNNLSVAFNTELNAVADISFSLYPGETFALAGESGSGKSVTALAVLRLLPENAFINAASIRLSGEELLTLPESSFCRVRGRKIGMVFQEPMTSLNPVMTIGDQIAEILAPEENASGIPIQKRVLALLRQVEIPEPELKINVYPHQLSGGQRQRVMIAMALAGNPALLVADEPTTSLDVTVQAQIIALLKRIQRETGMALWFISHDLALISNLADRVAVMQSGKIVETGKTAEVFKQPRQAYTRKLLAALPKLQNSLNHRTAPGSSAPLLKVSDFCCHYPVRKGLFKRIVGYVKAVDGVSFEIQQGRTLALVGESGCGKTTLGKSLLSLISKTSGTVEVDGVNLGALEPERLRAYRGRLQIIFQDPYSSMNPRMLVGEVISEGIKALYPQVNRAERWSRVSRLLEQVGLAEKAAWRYPHEFSGGQRQRICIARALAVNPKLIVCDEPTSALDVSVQAQIIELLKKLQKEQGISYLFITHDLALVAEFADEVAVMRDGRFVEKGAVEDVLNNPRDDYTQKLIAAIPRLRIDN